MSIDSSRLGNISDTIRRFEDIGKAEQASIERDRPKAKTAPQEQARPTPQQLRQAFVQELATPNHSSFVGRSQVAWSKLTANNPQISAKIEAFKSAHPEKMQILQEKGWKDLKGEMGVGMTRPRDADNLSMEEFRQEANTLISELVGLAAHDMDLPEVSWSACGTAGFNSDVDTAMSAKSGSLTFDQAYTLKFLRDTAHSNIFNGLSGIQLDTESYTPHIAQDETAKKLTTPEALQQFVTSESAMGILQCKVGFQNHPDEWNSFRDRELANTPPERQATVSAIMTSVETWHDALHFDVLKQVLVENPTESILSGLPAGSTVADIRQKVESMSPSSVQEQAAAQMAKDPDAYKKAALNQRMPVMLALANSSAQMDSRLNAIQDTLSQIREHAPDDPRIADLTRELEQGMISRDVVGKMLNSLQDEGTFGQGEGNVTLFRAGGQIDAGSLAKVHKTFKSKAEEMEQQIRQNQLGAHIGVNSLREQVKEARATREPPSASELTLAAYEEQQQFAHVVHEGLHKCTHSANPDKTAVDTAISAGKYCLRTVRNKLRAMEQTEADFKKSGKELPEGFHELKGAMKSAEADALCLEQCKRKFTLNRMAATTLLQEAISSNAEGRGIAVDADKLASDITALMGRLEAGGALSDETLLKREKMNDLVGELQRLGYVDEVITTTPQTAGSIADKIMPKDDGIRRVLQAMVGYSRTSVKTNHEDLNPLFERGDRITVEGLAITNAGELEDFMVQIETLSHSWQNMAFESGVLAPMSSETWVADNMNFDQIWHDAKKAV